MNLTPWFYPGDNPVRRGVYYTQSPFSFCESDGGYQYWNGKFWMKASLRADTANTVSEAYLGRKIVSNYQYVKWRGLATKEPK